ncbi:MAG: hypothetical protein CK604_13115 [Curvibacter sp. PD_MW3]|nr:MAG: hypothetical protein CK604_13115 [Curvibacter sp. PD_MW3]
MASDGAEAGQSVPAHLPTGRFSGREAFAQCVRDALACAAREGWRDIILSDATFADWPLHERVVTESLQAWAMTGRRLVMLATRFDAVQRHQPRFVAWRQTWDHIIECRQCRNADPADFPSALWSSAWVMQRHDVVRSVFVCDTDAARRLALRQTLEEVRRNGSPAFPASTLGL